MSFRSSRGDAALELSLLPVEESTSMWLGDVSDGEARWGRVAVGLKVNGPVGGE